MIKKGITASQINLCVTSGREVICKLFNKSSIPTNIKQERLDTLNELADILSTTHNLGVIKEHIRSINLDIAFGEIKLPITAVLWDHRNSFVETSVDVVVQLQEQAAVEGEIERRLIPKVEGKRVVTEIIRSRIKALSLMMDQAPDPAKKDVLLCEVHALRLAQTHPCELVYLKALDKYVLCIHTHKVPLYNDFNNLDRGFFLSLDGDAKQDHLLYIEVPLGVFDRTRFGIIDQMILEEQSKLANAAVEQCKQYRPIVNYKNWQNQWLFSDSSNDVSLFKIVNRLQKKETLLDHIDRILKIE